MALTIKHSFVSTKPDGNDNTLIRPSNWNADHTITGTLAEGDLALTDVTTNNATTGRHGFLPKLPDDSGLFLDGTGNWTTPAGGGDSVIVSEGEGTYSLDGWLSVGGNTGPSFPFVVTGAAQQGSFGFVNMHILADESETGIQITNTSNDGGVYTILVSGTGSGVGTGKFIIGSPAGAHISVDGSFVGINTDSPEYTLDVNGNLNVSGNLTIDGNPFGGVWSAIGEFNMDIVLSGEGWYKVGINTGSPQNNFTVYGPNDYGVMEVLGEHSSEASISYRTINVNKAESGHWVAGLNIGGDGNGKFGFFSGDISDQVMTMLKTGQTGFRNTNPAYTVDVNGDLNVSGNVYVDGEPLTINNDFKITTGTAATVAAGRAATQYAWRDEEIEEGSIELLTAEIISVSNDNPAVFEIADTSILGIGMKIDVVGGTGNNLSFSNQRITITNILNGTDFTASVGDTPIDGTIIEYTGGAVMGRGRGTSSTVYIVADVDEGHIRFIFNTQCGVIPRMISGGAYRFDDNPDFSLNGYGVFIGTMSANSGIDNDPPSFADPVNAFPAVTNSEYFDNGYGIRIDRSHGHAIIHATGEGFSDPNGNNNSNFWWDHSNNRLGLGMTNPQFTLDVTGDINFSGDLLKNGALFPITTEGTPARLKATASFGDPGFEIEFEAVADDSAGNAVTITLLADQDYVQTLVSMVGGNAITIVLRNTGGTIAATAQEVADAIGFSAPALALISVTSVTGTDPITLSGPSQVITFSGGNNGFNALTGFELYRDEEGLWVGRSDGSWGRVLFDSTTGPIIS